MDHFVEPIKQSISNIISEATSGGAFVSIGSFALFAFVMLLMFILFNE